ncbi:MAG: NAD(P)H-dependent oxidoreductase subunit E [Treponemataceae bacterium]
MEKIEVQICTGTTCFVMGGSDLLLLMDSLNEDLKEIVHIEGRNCMGSCKGNQCGKSPFVSVEGKLIPNASLSEVLEEVNKIAQERGIC